MRELGHRLVLSPGSLAEVREKMTTSPSLRKWLGLDDEAIETFLNDLPQLAAIVSGDYSVEGVVLDDPDDDLILAAALEGQASYLVTEDRHLLSLGSWQGIEILTRESLLTELDRQESL